MQADSDRYEPCRVLQANEISCICWFEDAIAHYGVPTALFDLYVLVENIEAAAGVLCSHGWTDAADRPADAFHLFGPASAPGPALGPAPVRPSLPRHRRLARHPAELSSGRTFLLHVEDWCFPVARLVRSAPATSTMSTASTTLDASAFLPRLPDLVDALIDSLLDADMQSMVFGHLRMQLAYLYGYVPEMKSASFALRLKYDHRQFHYDFLLTRHVSLAFVAHEQHVRQQLRDGMCPLPYDASSVQSVEGSPMHSCLESRESGSPEWGASE